MTSIEQQIQCVKREITMRGYAIAKIGNNEKKRRESMRELEHMRDVLQTLLRVQAGEKFREEG
jgi:hypothetical protein